MNADAGRRYHIQKADRILIFRTAHFTAEKGSVLHSGIYNREFSSVLASTAAAGIVYLVIVLNTGRTSLYSVVLALVVAVGFFPLFRRFVFRGRYLETVVDAHDGKVSIFLSGMTKRRKDVIDLREVVNIRIEKKVIGIENPDGVKFVEKISLQHGMVIPGFGEEAVFYQLALKLADGTERVLYADTDMHEVISAHDEIQEFLENAGKA